MPRIALRAEALVRDVPSIELAGAMDRAEVGEALNASSGFVLPAKRETFGLVFIEALFAGTPIIYPAGTAIDGLFDDAPFALRVQADDAAAIAAAIRTIMRNEGELKAELAKWQLSDDAKRFQRPGIAQQFAQGLQAALQTHGSGEPATG